MSSSVTNTYIQYKNDSNGKVVTNAFGDTVMQAVSQVVNSTTEYDLELPLMINLGVIHPLTENIDVELDWVDITGQDSRFESYIQRFRFGTEYRLDVMQDLLGISFRAGIADKKLTGGVGLNLFRAIQIDGAYAYDNFVKSYAYFGQVKIGW